MGTLVKLSNKLVNAERQSSTCRTGPTGADVEVGGPEAVVASWAGMETLPVLPHALSPQEKEQLGLTGEAAIVLGADGAAFADGVRAIASWKEKVGTNHDTSFSL